MTRTSDAGLGLGETSGGKGGGMCKRPDEGEGDDDHDHDEELARDRQRRDVAVPGVHGGQALLPAVNIVSYSLSHCFADGSEDYGLIN